MAPLLITGRAVRPKWLHRIYCSVVKSPAYSPNYGIDVQTLEPPWFGDAILAIASIGCCAFSVFPEAHSRYASQASFSRGFRFTDL